MRSSLLLKKASAASYAMLIESSHIASSFLFFSVRYAKYPIQRSIFVNSLAGLFPAALRNFLSSIKWSSMSLFRRFIAAMS